MAKRATITKTLRFDKKLIEDAEKLAAAEKRSFNNWVEWLIEREVKTSQKQKNDT